MGYRQNALERKNIDTKSEILMGNLSLVAKLIFIYRRKSNLPKDTSVLFTLIKY